MAPVAPVASSRTDAAVASVVDRVANRYLAETPIVGLAVAVARDGEVVHEAGYGLARRSPDIPAGPGVPFEYFSVSKPVTAVLLLRLAERGLLDLDAPAGKFVHELPEHYAGATLRQLLRHSSGSSEILIDEFDPEPRFTHAPSRADLLSWISGVTVVAPPDESWNYDGWGFVVAGLAAEDATQRSFAELIRTEMAQPLALRSFAWCPELASTRSQGYMSVNEAPEPIPAIDFGWFGGAGALCGTAGDLARWWLAVRSGQVISPASLQEWTTPVSLERNGAHAGFGYGLAVRLGQYGGHTKIGHTGDGAGGTSILAEYPDDRLLIVVATNTAGADVPYALEIEAAIARELLKIAGRDARDGRDRAGGLDHRPRPLPLDRGSLLRAGPRRCAARVDGRAAVRGAETHRRRSLRAARRHGQRGIFSRLAGPHGVVRLRLVRTADGPGDEGFRRLHMTKARHDRPHR